MFDSPHVYINFFTRKKNGGKEMHAIIIDQAANGTITVQA